MHYVTQLPSATCAVMSTGLVSPGLTLERALKWSVCLSCLILGHFCSVADLISSITLNLQDMAILRHLEDFALEVTLICFVWPQRAGCLVCMHALTHSSIIQKTLLRANSARFFMSSAKDSALNRSNRIKFWWRDRQILIKSLFVISSLGKGGMEKMKFGEDTLSPKASRNSASWRKREGGCGWRAGGRGEQSQTRQVAGGVSDGEEV